ncbi:MAG: C25 family cysteine peptidase, partial [Candidatus Krumholzibacteria bacterium]|nr:C25 family cysteine peptidase [Candidatus Krumholzibacteria bacterium]
MKPTSDNGRSRKAFAIAAVVASAFSGPSAADTLSLRLDLGAEQVAIERAPEGGRVQVSAPGYATLNEWGEPALPYRTVIVLLPQGHQVVAHDVRDVTSRVLERGFRSARAAGDVSEDGKRGSGEALARSQEGAFPGEHARYLGTGYLHGYAIASFALFPLRILDGDLVLSSEIFLEVSTAPGGTADTLLRERHRAGFRAGLRAELARLVVNAEAIEGYAFDEVVVAKERGGFRPAPYPSLEGSPVDYVIVTNDSLSSAYQALADFKTAKGVPTVVRTTEWIEANYRNGSDPAETIREFVKAAYAKWGVRYVLLGGDTGQVPARMCWSGFYDGGRSLPVDMYYGCLDGDWNADHDALFGEMPDDAPDLYAEVYIGRLPTPTAADVATLVSKVATYESSVDSAYTRRILMFSEVLFPLGWTQGNPITLNGGDLSDFVYYTYMLDPGLEVVRKYETWNLYTGAEPETRQCAIDSLNAGFDHVLHVGHGFRFNMSVGDASIQNADADALTNGSRLSNLYLLNCTAVAYTYYCLAEHYLRNPNGGAVSVVGANEAAYPNASSYYMNEYYRLLFVEGATHLGEAFARSRLPRTPLAYLSDNIDLWTHYVYSCLGDPEMPLWTNGVAPMVVGHAGSVGLGPQAIT